MWHTEGSQNSRHFQNARSLSPDFIRISASFERHAQDFYSAVRKFTNLHIRQIGNTRSIKSQENDVEYEALYLPDDCTYIVRRRWTESLEDLFPPELFYGAV